MQPTPCSASPATRRRRRRLDAGQVGFGLALALLGQGDAVGDRRRRAGEQLAEPVAFLAQLGHGQLADLGQQLLVDGEALLTRPAHRPHRGRDPIVQRVEGVAGVLGGPVELFDQVQAEVEAVAAGRHIGPMGIGSGRG